MLRMSSEEEEPSVSVELETRDLGGEDESEDVKIAPSPRNVPTTKADLPRHIELGGPDDSFCSNVVRTSRYTAYNFVPMNLFEQLQERSNFYFLCIGILQTIKEISPTNGVPTMAMPLSFILFVSALRAGIEDYHRHQSDAEESSRIYKVFNWVSHLFEDRTSAEIRIGDVVMCTGDQIVPSDLLFLSSSHARGHCFVETSSLDGETDLKPRLSIPNTHEAIRNEEQLAKLSGTLDWELPNKKFDVFKGRMIMHPGRDDITLEGSMILLRGTVVKNTEWTYGLAVYTGVETKIRQNVKRGKQKLKRSSIMRRVDKFILGTFGLQFLLCLIAAIIAGSRHAEDKDAFYLQIEGGSAMEGLKRFFTWFIILSQLVPISLIVSGEIVKTVQAFFINSDVSLYDPSTNQPALVRTSSLNEDLGQIEFVFSDKTGTLTQNKMEFRVAFVGAKQFGSSETEISKRVEARKKQSKTTGTLSAGRRNEKWTELVHKLLVKGDSEEAAVNFDERERLLDVCWGCVTEKPERDQDGNYVCPEEEHDPTALTGGHKLSKLCYTYLLNMAISNTITPIFDEELQKNCFQSSSPDELALCKFAQYMGFELEGRNPTRVKINKFGRGAKRGQLDTETITFNHLATLGFNSKRKRVTMIYQSGDKIFVMSKGADSSMLPLLKPTERYPNKQQDPMFVELQAGLIDMAQNGLRTLVVAFADRDEEWWQSWKGRYEQAAQMPEVGAEAKHQKGACLETCRICQTMQEMEEDCGLQLLGATSIEDRLQDLVPEAIEDLLDANVKVWMLTGDKRETAKNIGLACNLIDPDMEDPKNWADSRLIEVTGQWADVLHDKRELKNLFNTFDLDGDGHITRDELNYFIKNMQMPSSNSEEEMNKLFARVDRNHDGEIEFEEFVEFMRGTQLSLYEAVQSDVAQGLQVFQSTDPSLPVSMVVEGKAFGELYPLAAPAPGEKQPDEDEELNKLRDDFFFLASKCKSVVACRLTPFQKAKIVQEIKARRGVLTLAIGDGANDEAMIVEADVGVGISGLEGTAASRAADYAVAQFRFLHTLMFVHGHWSYHRIAYLVPYIFYKAVLSVLVMYWFGFYSQMSGQQLYNPWVYMFYNVIYTAMPVLILAIMEQHLDRNTLEDVPKAYAAISHGALFNARIFSVWIFRSIFHSLIILFIPLFAMNTQTMESDGLTSGYWLMSMVMFTCVVLLATLRICLDFVNHTWVHHFFVWGSLGVYFLFAYLLSVPTSFNLDLHGVVERMLSSTTCWLIIILTVLVPIIIDFATLCIRREFRPALPMVLQERQKMTIPELSRLPPPTLKPIPGYYSLGRRYPSTRVVAVQGGSREEKKELDGKDHRKTSELIRPPAMSRERMKSSRGRMNVLLSHWLRIHNRAGSDFSSNLASADLALTCDR